MLKVLETARKEKFIGQALEAKVQLVAAGDNAEPLEGLSVVFAVSIHSCRKSS